MAVSKLDIKIPGGQHRTIRIEPDMAGENLADALEQKGLPLNMRCGGRGLCRGCTVEVDSADGHESFRACQRSVAELPDSISQLIIPENSWRDHSLHGVSVFEIHTKANLAASTQTGYGLALDIGTTTIAGALWDFSNNHCLAHISRPNPQARYGDNVVSRINFAIENATGSDDLQHSLVHDGLIPLIEALCRIAAIDEEAIDCATASGNPTMLHTLAGESVSGFGKYPFQPVFLGKRILDSEKLGFNSSFQLILLPGLGPFVGADIAVGALASGMLEAEGPVLLIDFGTNGEILLSHEGEFFATATAAGPAFEGGRLSCGAAARDGVISSIGRDENGWNWTLSAMKGGEPTGISGAAYVDFLATGSLCNLLDHFGRFDRQSPEVHERRSGDDTEWAIALSEKIFVTEADVAELLQAKAAIGGGVASLMEMAGIESQDLKKVFVAGGFGYHLNPAHAVRVGLLPDVPLDRVQMIGNASLGGACLLLNEHAGELLGPLLDNCRVVELNQVESFEDNFTDSLMLEPMDL